MKTITLPQLRQTYEYDCGAKALQAVLVYYGIEIADSHILKDAKTSKKGTPVKGIIDAAKKYGLKTISAQMSIEDIKKYINKKIPVILVLQAWTQKNIVDWEKDWMDGHYVVAIGYAKNKILFDDPSSFKRTYLKYDELEKRWHDVDSKGKKYYHHGIAIFGKTPKFKRDELIHMD
ncbi:MAG: cysteine peptidase family C39 domain-containing protein [bacterium]